MSTALIECQQLTKRYGSTRALSNVDLTLHSGSPIALIGPNGAGKTTFLSLLCGFIRPTEGSVNVLGARAGSHQAISQLSALPQDAALDPNFTVETQLTHYARLRSVDKPRTEVHRVLDLVQLLDRAKAKPESLSHGMRKRVLLAQSLIGNPQLILLDEPTAGIDPPNVKIIRELITSEAENATFIVSSHNLDELEKVCTTVVHLANGELQSVGAVDDVANEGVLTILLRTGEQIDLDIIRSVAGVTAASMRSASELVVEYNSESHPNTDINLLTSFAQNNVRYRRLSKGRSLEQQIFSA